MRAGAGSAHRRNGRAAKWTRIAPELAEWRWAAACRAVRGGAAVAECCPSEASWLRWRFRPQATGGWRAGAGSGRGGGGQRAVGRGGREKCVGGGLNNNLELVREVGEMGLES